MNPLLGVLPGLTTRSPRVHPSLHPKINEEVTPVVALGTHSPPVFTEHFG